MDLSSGEIVDDSLAGRRSPMALVRLTASAITATDAATAANETTTLFRRASVLLACARNPARPRAAVGDWGPRVVVSSGATAVAGAEPVLASANSDAGRAVGTASELLPPRSESPSVGAERSRACVLRDSSSNHSSADLIRCFETIFSSGVGPFPLERNGRSRSAWFELSAVSRRRHAAAMRRTAPTVRCGSSQYRVGSENPTGFPVSRSTCSTVFGRTRSNHAAASNVGSSNASSRSRA